MGTGEIERVTVDQVIGANVRRLRERFGLTQDQVAEAAQRRGLAWRRSSVAMLERGERTLLANEVFLLPFLFFDAVQLALPGLDTKTAEIVTLAELLRPDPKSPGVQVVALAPTIALGRPGIDKWLSGPPPVRAYRTLRPGAMSAGEAEQKAARSLSTTVAEVVEAARRAWGRTLTEERELRLRLSEAAGSEDARARQARRGHITRTLLAELTPHLTHGRTDHGKR